MQEVKQAHPNANKNGDELGPHKLKPLHYLLAHKIALGATEVEIRKETGMSVSQISHIFNNSLILAEVDRLRSAYEIDAKQTIQRILPKAIEINKTILEDVAAPMKLRSEVGFKFMDRAMGKPALSEDTSTGKVIELIRALDDFNRGKDGGDSKEMEIPVKDVTKSQDLPDLLNDWKPARLELSETSTSDQEKATNGKETTKSEESKEEVELSREDSE